MKRIINGKRYDTETAEKLASAYASCSVTDFNYWQEDLYRKRTGEFFLHGEGNANSRYSRRIDTNSWSGGEKLIPMTVKEAMDWAEKNLDGDEYENIFGEVSETGEKKIVTFSLSLDVIEQIRRQAAEAGCTMSEVIERLIRK